MKKSKLMKALLVFGMSMVTATAIVGITACDDEHTHVDENKDGKCDICQTDMTKPGGDNEDLNVAVEKVELNKSSLTLEIGGEETLTATVTPATATNKTVSWSVAPAGIVTVTDGKVKALAAGDAVVTATADGKKAECSVKVNAPAPLPEVTEDEWQAALSDTAFVNFTATLSMSDSQEGESIDLKADLTGGKYYYNDDNSHYYFSKDGETYYKYEKSTTDEDYAKTETTQTDYENNFSERWHLNTLFFKDCFASFTYDSDKNAYVGTGVEIGDGNVYNIVFKFDHGKLIHADIDFGAEAHILIDYSAYGTTVVELPAVGGGETPDPGPVDLPKITEWASVGDAVYGEVHENEADFIYHHIYLDDTAAKAYDFDEYEATVKVDGKDGEVVQCNAMSQADITAHTYHLHIRIKANRYQTAEFTINFKKDGETVAVGTYTRAGDKEIALDSVAESVSVGDTVTINVISINGSTDLTDKEITWSIADTEGEGVASIPEDSHSASVVVTALAEGKATLTCTVGEGADAFTKTCAITVVEGEVVITVVDVSEKATFNNDFQYAGKEAVQLYFNLQDAKYSELVQQIDPSKTTVTVTMDGEESTSELPRKEWQGAGLYNLWIQATVEGDWSHDYEFRFSFKNAKGDEVAYGNYSRVAPKSLELDKTTVNLTLKDGETVTDTLTATTNKVEGEIQWSIDDENIATITDNGDGTVTVTAVAKGSATITAMVDGLTKTCKVNVLEDGEEAPVTTITDFSKFNGPYGENYIQFRFEETDKNVDIYPDIKASYDHTNVDGELTAHKEFFQGGGAKTYIVTVKFNSAPVSGTTYKIDLCDASNNILATFSWTAD